MAQAAKDVRASGMLGEHSMKFIWRDVGTVDAKGVLACVAQSTSHRLSLLLILISRLHP